jgi:CheY-like chemotaxis protein
MSTRPKARVLFVDDDPMLLVAVVRLLGSEFDVATADRAGRALEYLAAGERFDAIMCDVRMPDLGGEAFRDLVAEKWPDMVARIVFVTGKADVAGVDALAARTGNRVLPKPFTTADLRAVLEDVRRK